MDTPSASSQRVTQLLCELEPRGQGRPHGTDPAGLRRLAAARPSLHERPTARPHPADDRTGQRGLFAPGRPDKPKLAEPRPLRGRRGPSDAPDFGQLRQELSIAEARRRRAKGGVGRSGPGHPGKSQEIIDLHEALERLATLDARKAEVVELKYFGGLNYDEIAEVLKISAITARRDWEFAKAWLYSELHRAD